MHVHYVSTVAVLVWFPDHLKVSVSGTVSQYLGHFDTVFANLVIANSLHMPLLGFSLVFRIDTSKGMSAHLV